MSKMYSVNFVVQNIQNTKGMQGVGKFAAMNLLSTKTEKVLEFPVSHISKLSELNASIFLRGKP